MSVRSIALAAVLALATTGVPACGSSNSSQADRWVTTSNTKVDIDWDKIGEAYKVAEGPEDFERRVNEIYAGDEVISVSVIDEDEKSQLVTGFFDKNEDGKVTEEEKIFVITRNITSEEAAQYQVQGYNHYASYRSPMWDIASGMVLGSMMSRAFMPGYSPMYRSGYTTSASRTRALATHRNSYRSKNPSKYPNHAKRSSSGRSYGSKGRSSFGSRSSSSRSSSRSSFGRGGGGFGVTRKGKLTVIRLTS